MTKYPNYNIGKSDPLEELDLKLNKIKKKRFENSFPIPEKSEKIHQDLLKKINESIPFTPLNRKCYCMGCFNVEVPAGCLTEDENGLTHPLVEFYVGHLCEGENYFRHVVAHEYGHIIFNENFDSINSQNPYNTYLFDLTPLEIHEAYAFWFGDFITNIKTNFAKLNYRHINFADTIQLYHELNSLGDEEGISECFNKKRLAELFSPYKKRIINEFKINNYNNKCFYELRK